MLLVHKVLIANRGEIAVRIAKTIRDMGFIPLGVYTEVDRNSLHRKFVIEDRLIKSYLNDDEIVKAAIEMGAEAIHPGYGFLSENPDFARKVIKHGLKFIGPTPESIDQLGDKVKAKRFAEDVGVPTLPYIVAKRPEDILEFGKQHGFPLIIKAAGGGGGIGMRIVKKPEDTYQLFEQASKEVEKSFKNPDLFVEPYVERARHIEVQVLGDGDRYVHLFERECSIQRRYQKIVEEAPSPIIDEATRSKLTEGALALAQGVKYVNAGTFEFIYDVVRRRFYFMEVNTRLQVEHPVTEMITGVDIVHQQLIIAFEGSLSLKQNEISRRGHAIEARINAENPFTLLPSPGVIERYVEPHGPWIRVDSGVTEGCVVPAEYNPLIAKVIAWGVDRFEALNRLNRALNEYVILGVDTNIPVLRSIINHPAFIKGTYTVSFLSECWNDIIDWIKNREILHAIIFTSVLSKDRGVVKTVADPVRNKAVFNSYGDRDKTMYGLKRRAWFYLYNLKSKVRRRV